MRNIRKSARRKKQKHLRPGVQHYMVAVVLTVFSMVAFSQQQNWTHFRGSNLDGLAGKGSFPLIWNDTIHIRWMKDVPGRAWSSPLIFGKQVWLTTASPGGQEMGAICLDRETGKVLFNLDLFSPGDVKRKHPVNSYATPTGAIEEHYVYLHYGRYGTVCLNTQTGRKVWERTDIQCEHIQGPGSSLLLHGEKLIVHMEGTDVQDIYALNKATGETIWKSSRDQRWLEPLLEIGKKAYITPIVIEAGGRELLISNGSAACDAFDIETGERIWYIVQGEDSTISMPVFSDGKLYFYTSFVTTEAGEKYCELWCVDPNGKGDLSQNIIWRKVSPILQLLTPVVYEGLLYTVDTRSRLECIDASTGNTVWSEQLKGKFNSSPVIANDHLYISSTRGVTIVLKTGTSYDPVAENKLTGEIWATPAFLDNKIFMRTSKGLYCISEAKELHN